MRQEKIDSPDMQLAKLLIARRLKDEGIVVDGAKIVASLNTASNDTPEIHIRYPLRKLAIVVRSSWYDPDEVTTERISLMAEEQAKQMSRIHERCDGLEEQLRQAKAVARREVAKANRRGLPWRLLDVRPSTAGACSRWLPAPEIVIGMLDCTLAAERRSVVYDDLADLTADLTDDYRVREQGIRAARKAWFDEAGAGGGIDAVAVAALRKGGHDVADVIRRLRENVNGFLLESAGDRLNLWWRDGLINVSAGLAEGVAYSECSFTLERCDKQDPVGQPARAIVDDPILDGMTVRTVSNSLGKLEVGLAPKYHLFDARTCEPREDILPM